MLSWLLFKKSIKTSWVRIVLLSGGIALGVAMLLAFVVTFNALGSTTQRNAWRTSIEQAVNAPTGPEPSIVQPNTLYATVAPTNNLAIWHGRTITVTLLHQSGAGAPRLADLKTPSAGEYYVSPGLAAVMKLHPEDQLGDRFGHTNLGVIPDAYVTSPDSLDVIAGVSSHRVMESGMRPVQSINESAHSAFFIDQVTTAILYLGVFILLFPVVLLISITAQLGSAQREQRYAALRLVGASRSQVNRIIVTESLVAAIPGVAFGWLLFLATLPLLREFRFDSGRFWPQDLIATPLQYVGIFFGILLMVLFANWWGMRHVRTSPLGVARRQNIAKPPRWWYILPLMAGMALIAYARLTTIKNGATTKEVWLIIAGVILVMIGLVIAGAWLTRTVSNSISKFTGSATTLLGTRYIGAHATRVFRSVSGVVVALFAASFYLTTVSGLDDLTVKNMQTNGYAQLKESAVFISSPGGQLPNDMDSLLMEQPYIHAVRSVDLVTGAYTILPCDDARTFTTITCPAGSAFVGVNFWAPSNEGKIYGKTKEAIAMRLVSDFNAAPESVFANDKGYLVATSSASLERLRSVVAAKTGTIGSSMVDMTSGQDARRPMLPPIIASLSGLVYAGVVITMLVSIVSLCISTVSGLFERRRSLYTLHLGGMTVRQLKQMVIIESLIPLIAVSVLSVALGVAIGYMFMDMVSVSLDAKLSPVYLIVTTVSLACATLAIYLILPIVRTLTDLRHNRTE